MKKELDVLQEVFAERRPAPEPEPKKKETLTDVFLRAAHRKPEHLKTKDLHGVDSLLATIAELRKMGLLP